MIGILTATHEGELAGDDGRTPISKRALDTAMARQGYRTYADLLSAALVITNHLTREMEKHVGMQPRVVFEGDETRHWVACGYSALLEKGKPGNDEILPCQPEDLAINLYWDGYEAITRMVRFGWFANSDLAINKALLFFLEIEEHLTSFPNARIFIELLGTRTRSRVLTESSRGVLIPFETGIKGMKSPDILLEVILSLARREYADEESLEALGGIEQPYTITSAKATLTVAPRWSDMGVHNISNPEALDMKDFSGNWKVPPITHALAIAAKACKDRGLVVKETFHYDRVPSSNPLLKGDDSDNFMDERVIFILG